MPTTGTVLAKNMAIYLNGTPDTIISCQVDATLSLSTTTFETTCKDSGSWAQPRPGTKSWTMTGTGNLAWDATYGYSDMHALWYNQTLSPFVISTGVTGDKQQYGDGYLTELEMTSSGNDAAVTFSFTVTGAGALTLSTVS
jgi:predicted secreted protein